MVTKLLSLPDTGTSWTLDDLEMGMTYHKQAQIGKQTNLFCDKKYLS